MGPVPLAVCDTCASPRLALLGIGRVRECTVTHCPGPGYGGESSSRDSHSVPITTIFYLEQSKAHSDLYLV